MNIETILQECEGAALLPPKYYEKAGWVTLPNQELRTLMQSPDRTLALLAEVRRLREHEFQEVERVTTMLNDLRKGARLLFADFQSLRYAARHAAELKSPNSLERLEAQLAEVVIPEFCPPIDPCAACQRNEEIEEWMVARAKS
ncbi:MAG TPA: hypothetical protein PKY05_14435 [Fibrobacteria bacterium]|nr:hypothetical protein [Fibrobacteria bacterium]